MRLLLAIALLTAGPAPTEQTLVYFNARMALREGAATEAVKLWLLRNALESETGRISAYDADFRSVTWAALGELGLCQDGYPKDDTGAGLWPLAMHNWVVENMRRPLRAEGPSPFEAFELGRQQRFVSVHDVLDAAELRTVRFARSECLQRTRLLLDAGEPWNADLRDRRTAARVLRHLLRRALETLTPTNATGRGVIEARIFDLNLRLAGLSARAERRARSERRREGRRSGLSREELADADPDAARIAADSEEGRILRASLSWSADEWMALSSGRRRFLFAHAVRTEEDPARARPLMLAVIDRLVEARRGEEIESWIAHLDGAGDARSRRLVWSGERGRALLSLDRETGFRGRAPIALHRGVDALAAGRLAEAIRAMAHALRWAEDSPAAEAVRGLTRRWLSFVASRFRVTDELFAMLRSVVPRADYSAVLEDQLWHAALSADADSFERCVRHQLGRGALVRRAEALRSLARGDAGAFTTGMDTHLTDSPYFAMRFLRRFVERLEAQDAEVRARLVPTLTRLKARLEEEVARTEGTGGRQRSADALVDRMRAIIEGVSGVLPPDSPGDEAHHLSPEREVFVGSFRVAPSDDLPWPFRVAEVQGPPVFSRVTLRPEEWRERRAPWSTRRGA